MQFIVGFNGPPKSGKDTLADMLRRLLDQEYNIPSHLDHLARPMRQMAMSLVGLNPDDFESYNKQKDQPQSLLKQALSGQEDSIRRLMIRTSEDFIKPVYGQNFWGRKLIDDHKWLSMGYPGILIVPDVGFPAEVAVFDSLWPKVQTLIIQTDRPGTSWKGDSRVPCEGQRNTAHLFNDKTPYEGALWILDHMRGHLGWNLNGG